jgi:hypothetical protein
MLNLLTDATGHGLASIPTVHPRPTSRDSRISKDTNRRCMESVCPSSHAQCRDATALEKKVSHGETTSSSTYATSTTCQFQSENQESDRRTRWACHHSTKLDHMSAGLRLGDNRRYCRATSTGAVLLMPSAMSLPAGTSASRRIVGTRLFSPYTMGFCEVFRLGSMGWVF